MKNQKLLQQKAVASSSVAMATGQAAALLRDKIMTSSSSSSVLTPVARRTNSSAEIGSHAPGCGGGCHGDVVRNSRGGSLLRDVLPPSSNTSLYANVQTATLGRKKV